MKSFLYALLLPLILLAACTPRSDNPAPAPDLLEPTFWQKSAAPYQGTVLRGISEESPPSLYIRDVLAPAFETETGIVIDLTISNNSTIEQAISQGGGEFDFVYVEQDVIYGYLAERRLLNLSHLLNENPDLVAPTFDTRNFTNFVDAFRDPIDGDLYGVPIEAFIKVYLYRRDLFDDPEIRAAFAQEHLYPLAPAVTFEQYRDIAQFFTRYGRENDLDLWGTTVQAASDHEASFYEFFETIAPSFGVYNWGIDLENHRASTSLGGHLDGEDARKALAFWIEMLNFAPPEARSSTWHGVRDSFAQGRAAQGWIYGEYVSALADRADESGIQIGVALPPTSAGVLEEALVGAGYLGYYDGASFSIPVGSSEPEATLIWLQWLGQPEIQPDWAVANNRVVHISTFDDPLVQEQDDLLDGYYTLMKNQGRLFAGGPPIPYHAPVREAIMPFIHAAIRGEMTPAVALEEAAATVDELLVELGYAEPIPVSDSNSGSG